MLCCSFIVVSVLPFVYLMTLVIFYALSDRFISCMHLLSCWICILNFIIVYFFVVLVVFYLKGGRFLCMFVFGVVLYLLLAVTEVENFRTSFYIHFLVWSCWAT